MIESVRSAAAYYGTNQTAFWDAVARHLELSLAALAISIAVCLPLGIAISRRAGLAQPIIAAFSSLRVLPSLVILFLALPYLGVGFRPALVALTVLACPPILINTYTGMRGVDRAVIEAADGMGMSGRTRLARVELPLAMPAVLAGVRLAGVEVVASATLAALIGGGGLGDFIVRGYSLYRADIMLVGAIPVALLAVSSEALFSGLQRWFARRAA